MIFSFYIFLFIIALVLIFLGYDSDTDVLKIVAYGFIFMLGFMLISETPFGAVEDCQYLENYTNNVYSYGENYTDYHWDYDYTINPSEATVRLFHIKQYPEYVYNCQAIESRPFGFWIAVLGVLGFASVYLQRKNGRYREE